MSRSVVTLGILLLGASISASVAADNARSDVSANISPQAAADITAAVKDEGAKFTGNVAPSAAKVTLSEMDRSAAIGDQPSINPGSLALSANADAGSNKLDVLAVRADARTLDRAVPLGGADAASRVGADALPK